MPKELSKKDKRIKAMMEKMLASPNVTFHGRYRRRLQSAAQRSPVLRVYGSICAERRPVYHFLL
jgi:hypothetical protein